MQCTRTGFTAGPDSRGTSASTLPFPIEPYRPEPKFTMDQIVTPETIIPACYFEILSIHYDTHEQAHYYTIKSLRRIGDRRKYIHTLDKCLGLALRCLPLGRSMTLFCKTPRADADCRDSSRPTNS